jgi:hypothetical protein
MAISTAMDYSGITHAQKQSAIAFLHDSEINEVSADPSLLEFKFFRDPMLQDIRVQVRNRKTNKTFSKVIPDYMLTSTSSPPSPSLTVSNAFAQAQASVSSVGNNHNAIFSNGASYGSIVNNNTNSTVNITSDDIVVKGKSLLTFMQKIEEHLSILIPNAELEKEYLELADLRMKYMEKERYILAKKKTWDLLNKDADNAK